MESEAGDRHRPTLKRVNAYASSRAKQLEKERRAQNAASRRADRSADQEAAHAWVIAVTPITFDVGAEKAARKEPAAPRDRAGDNAFLRSCVRS